MSKNSMISHPKNPSEQIFGRPIMQGDFLQKWDMQALPNGTFVQIEHGLIDSEASCNGMYFRRAERPDIVRS